MAMKLHEIGYQSDAEKKALIPAWEEWSYFESFRR
jgi:hypothetical protein